MENKTINISLPKELLDMVDELSGKELRNRSETIRKAINLYLGSGGERGLWVEFSELKDQVENLELQFRIFKDKLERMLIK